MTNQGYNMTPDGRCVQLINQLYPFFNHGAVSNRTYARVGERACLLVWEYYAAVLCTGYQELEEILIPYCDIDGTETKA